MKNKQANIVISILVIIVILVSILGKIGQTHESSIFIENASLEQDEIQENLENIPTEEVLEKIPQTIDELTAEDLVVSYLKEHGKLPAYYITKAEARKLGWQSTYNDLCDAAPGKAIGGDYYGDFENNLPKSKGRKYYEADINYICGKRNAERIVFSNDGLVFVTKDHYKTFEQR